MVAQASFIAQRLVSFQQLEATLFCFPTNTISDLDEVGLVYSMSVFSSHKQAYSISRKYSRCAYLLQIIIMKYDCAVIANISFKGEERPKGRHLRAFQARAKPTK
jgi:hypothetical protein